MIKNVLLVLFSFLGFLGYGQISVSEFLELNDPSISFDTVAKSTLSVKRENGKFGLVNALGVWVVPPVYDELGNIREGTYQLHTRLNWDNGIVMVKKLGKYGAINCLGPEVIPCKYIEFSRSEDGNFNLKDNTGKRFLADRKGKILSGTTYVYSFGFRRVNLDKENYSEQTRKYSYGFIDKNGGTIFKLKNSPYIFSILGNSEGMTAFVMYPIISGGLGKNYGTIGFLDSTGKIAVSPIYSAKYLSGGRGKSDWIYKPAFHNGLALVFRDDSSVYIDKTGKEVLNFKDKPGKVNAFNDFSNNGFALISYAVQENENYTHYVEIIDTTGRAVIHSSGHVGTDGMDFTDISGLEYFYVNEKEGKTLYNAKLEKQFYIPRFDENYKYSFYSFPDEILTCVLRKDKKTGTAEYTFIDRKGEPICEYLPTDIYYEPATGITIMSEGRKLIMRNRSNEVIYSCDSCYSDNLSSLKDNHYSNNVSGVFWFWEGKEVLLVNYKGVVIDRFPTGNSVISNFQNISVEYKIYKNTYVDPDVKIAVTQSELDKIYQEMPWKNMR